ncbi:MAG: ankyrin repeat domain-containing protein [Acidobacteria bacterium]|nr:MAG: ankyrin repeat domain-containing protein [Acidobacteriota bacterium]
MRIGPRGETALHVAVRRRRLDMVDPLLDAGAEIGAATTGGKTARVHAYRRGTDEAAEVLASIPPVRASGFQRRSLVRGGPGGTALHLGPTARTSRIMRRARGILIAKEDS